MSPEGVAFVVVLVAVGSIPGIAALLSHRIHSRRLESRMSEIVALLRQPHRRAIGYVRADADVPDPRSSKPSIVRVPRRIRAILEA